MDRLANRKHKVLCLQARTPEQRLCVRAQPPSLWSLFEKSSRVAPSLVGTTSTWSDSGILFGTTWKSSLPWKSDSGILFGTTWKSSLPWKSDSGILFGTTWKSSLPSKPSLPRSRPGAIPFLGSLFSEIACKAHHRGRTAYFLRHLQSGLSGAIFLLHPAGS